jgi:hypothetical protein
LVLLCFLGENFVLADLGKLQASVMCLDPWRFGGGRRTRFVGHLSLTAAGAPWRFLQIRREEEQPDQFVFAQASRGEERTRERGFRGGYAFDVLG